MLEFNKKIKKVSNIRNLKNFLILCLIFVMLFPAATNLLIINIKSEGQKTSFINLKDSVGYTVSFIHINGSIANNWSDTADLYDWCYGLGTWEEPYIIENVTINASSSPTGNGIYIDNSKNDYFIIRNCMVYNAPNTENNGGIKLENTNNGTLTMNNCSNNGRNGIILYNSCNNNTLSGNTANYNPTGIYLFSDCDKNTISGNTANDNNNYGIIVYTRCDNNTISGNTAINTVTTKQNTGIILTKRCNNNTISGNNANDNVEGGITVVNDSNNNTISGNNATGNRNYGIYLRLECDNNTILGNSVINNHFGMYIYTSDDNTITGNTVNDNNEYGMVLYSSNDNSISENSLSNIVTTNQNMGIVIGYHSVDNIISRNTLNDNNYIGIYSRANDGNTIKNNTINRNDLGIMLYESNNNNASDNTLKDNGYCIYEYDCTVNTIEDNDCSGTTLQLPIFIDGTSTGVGAHNWTWVKDQPWCSGFGTWSDPYVIAHLKISGFGLFYGIEISNSNVFFIIQNCTVFNSYSGIYFHHVNNSRLINNTCSNNQYGIYLDESCNNNTISGNIANNNSEDGIYLYSACNNNTISGNEINDNIFWAGLSLYKCNHNTISGNIANNNEVGIDLEMDCTNNTISGNIINDNRWVGLFLYDCNNNAIINNAINNTSEVGISLYGDNEYNEFTENILYNNTLGIEIRPENSNNSIYENFFLNNGKHASDNGTDNHWNNSYIGNYWDDYLDNDLDDNGIGDSPYPIAGIAGSQDNFPIWDDGEDVAPILNINTPLGNDLFGASPPSFNLNIIEENLNASWYTLDNGLTNTTFFVNGTIDPDIWNSCGNGTITIRFYVNDTKGYIGSAEVIVRRDIVAPLIDILTPTNGVEFDYTPIFEISIYEGNLDKFWYTIDEGIHNYTINELVGTVNSAAWDAIPSGPVTIRFYARDLSGNVGTVYVIVVKTFIQEEPPPGIPGYNLFLIVGMMSLVATIIIRKRFKS